MIRTLSDLRYVDMLVHVSQMDLQRNLDKYSSGDSTVFDAFIPGWRDAIKAETPRQHARQFCVIGRNLLDDSAYGPPPNPS